MIDFLSGVLYSVEDDSIIIEVNGVGYQVFVSRPDVFRSQINEKSFIYTHHYMREDWMGLFGFKEKEERYLFRLLLSVSGIGPKGALAIIAQGNPNYVIKAIAMEDEKALVKMPGVGKKTAQRIILDLKDKVKGLNFKGLSLEDIEVNNQAVHIEEGGTSDLYEALKALGYHDQEIVKAIQGLGDAVEYEKIDILIKKALQNLMKG